MKKLLPVGLVVEGNATGSALLQLPGLADEIGPVKSSAFRVARRFSNALRAGYAVASYEELQETRLVLIRVPDAALDRVVEELAAVPIRFKQMSFVVCETWLSSDELQKLALAGAHVASVTTVAGSSGEWFICEGDVPAVRQVKRLLERCGGRVLQLRPGCKSLYFAAELLVTSLPVSLLAAAQSALREAGISGKVLSGLLDQLARKMLKNFRAGSRLLPHGSLTACPQTAAVAYLEHVDLKLPDVSNLIQRYLPDSESKPYTSGTLK